VSRSRTSEDETDEEEFTRALDAHKKMLQQGRSFSGRERNCCFLNLGNRSESFANISAAAGLDFPDDGRSLVTVDWDQDGDLDVWLSNRNAPRLRFLRNDMPADSHSLMVRPVGNGRDTNRDAIGARVEVMPSGEIESEKQPRQIKTVRAGEGFLSQSSKWLHFGLGPKKQPQTIKIHWPGGGVETFSNLQVDGRYVLLQGTGKAEKLARRQGVLKLKPEPLTVPPASGSARIPLLSLLPMPATEYQTSDGGRQQLSIGKGRPVLVNLWATWCAPCREELAEMAKRKDEFAEHNLDVVALCMDSLGEEKTDPQAAEKFLDQIHFPFTRGTATEHLANLFQSIHNLLVVNNTPLPAPTSFLIDGEGRLSVIYKGPVPLDRLFADCRHASRSREERFMESAAVPGKLFRSAALEERLKLLELANHIKIADGLKQSGAVEDAEAQLRAGLKIADRADLRTNLGSILLDQGRLNEAEVHLMRAIAIDPAFAAAYGNLANLRIRQNRPDDAIVLYEKALELDPDFALAHYNLAMLLSRLRRFEEAKDHYRLAVAADGEFSEAYRQWGNLLRHLGQPAEAIERYESALAADPANAQLHNDWGELLATEGQMKAAAAQFRRALELVPDYPAARENLRRAEMSLKR
jgi:tetratricopeptide (TPR) repeat protein